MTVNTFNKLCTELQPLIKKQVTKFRVPIPVDERVAITLWQFSN